MASGDYRFTNLLGGSYRGGTLTFTGDGRGLLSARGNRTNILDLTQNRSLTLGSESRKNIRVLSLSKDQRFLIQVDVTGRAVLINFSKGTILHHINFGKKGAVNDVAWSPDSKWVAVSVGNILEIWEAPCAGDGWRFEKWRGMGGHRSEIIKICWSEDSKYVLTSGDDMQVRLYSVYDSADHHQEIVGGSRGATTKNGVVKKVETDKDKDKAKKKEEDEDDQDDEGSLSDFSEGSSSSTSASGASSSDDKEKEKDKEWKKGKLGRLLGYKSMKEYGGFKPVIFAELRSAVKGAYFSKDKTTIFCVSKDGVVAIWKYILHEKKTKKTKSTAAFGGFAEEEEEPDLLLRPGSWSCVTKAFLNIPPGNRITSTDFCVATNALLVGMSGGIFALHEMLPEPALLHTLSVGANPLDSVCLSPTGEWIAVGSQHQGELLVWEWQSETYIVKQKGHHHGVRCIAYSPTGYNVGGQAGKNDLGGGASTANAASGGTSQNVLATGGFDGKVKLWSCVSGFCYVTFKEHTAEITDICFTPQANAVISASADGSVRAYDLLRYRNFRTFVAPPGYEKKIFGFDSVAVDNGGEIVAAACKGESYAVLVWSIQKGDILEVLTGNEGPVGCLEFSPNLRHPGQLVCGSWDGNLTVTDLFKRKGSEPERLANGSAVLDIAFDPRGSDIVACSTLAGHITFWDVDYGAVKGSIEGIRDIQSARQARDINTATNTRGKKKSDKLKKFTLENVDLSQHFSKIAYAASGHILIAVSKNSPIACLYSTNEYTLLNRMCLTLNQSLTGINVLLNSGKTMNSNGEVWAEFDLSDSEDDLGVGASEEHNRKRRRMQESNTLPGVKVGDTAKAYTANEFHCHGCSFSSDAKSFGVATTQGVYYYELENATLGGGGASAGGYGTALEKFQPAIFTKNVSKGAVFQAILSGNLTKAFVLALALNDFQILKIVYQRIGVAQIKEVVESIGTPLLPPLFNFLNLLLQNVNAVDSTDENEIKKGDITNKSITTNEGGANVERQIERHINWVEALLDIHGQVLFEILQKSYNGGHNLNPGMDVNKKKEKKAAGVDPLLRLRTLDASEVQCLLIGLLKTLTNHSRSVNTLFRKNLNTLEYLALCSS